MTPARGKQIIPEVEIGLKTGQIAGQRNILVKI
jgi:hypothetical protein